MLLKLVRQVFPQYGAYWVVERGSSLEDPARQRFQGARFLHLKDGLKHYELDEFLAANAWYHGPESETYACIENERIVGLCFFWYGDRYRSRNFWPLAAGEAKLVQIEVRLRDRSRGIGSSLIEYATRDILSRGFHRLYARIWHSNAASLRAFGRCGWKCIALVVEIRPIGCRTPFRLRYSPASLVFRKMTEHIERALGGDKSAK